MLTTQRCQGVPAVFGSSVSLIIPSQNMGHSLCSGGTFGKSAQVRVHSTCPDG